MTTALRDRLWGGGAAVVLVGAIEWALWRGPGLPLGELPERLGHLAAARGAPPAGPPSTWLHDRLLAVLLQVLPPWPAERLVVGLLPILFAVAAWTLARRLDRPPWVALLAIPLAAAQPLALGHVDLLLALPALLLGLALVDALGERPRLFELAALLVAGAVVAIQPLLPWLLVVGGLLLLAARPGLARLLPLALLAAVAGLALTLPAGPAAAPPEPLSQALILLPRRILVGGPGQLDDLALLGLAAGFLLLAGAASPVAGGDDEAPPIRLAYRADLLFVFALIAALPWPVDFVGRAQSGTAPGDRLAAAALLGVLLQRGALPGWRRLLLVPIIVTGLTHALWLGGRLDEAGPRSSAAPPLFDDGRAR